MNTKQANKELLSFLKKYTPLNFENDITEYSIHFSTKITNITKETSYSLDYIAYQEKIIQKLGTENQFSFDMFYHDYNKELDIYITTINNTITNRQLTMCKNRLKDFFITIDKLERKYRG